MPVVLALLLALAALLAAPSVITAHDLEPTSATPDVTVVIGSSLSPREVRVPTGSVVAWVNRDDERHRVRSRSGPERFDSGDLEPGERFAVRLSSTGTYGYVDDRERDNGSYHGQVVVTAGEAPANGSDAPATGGGSSSGGGSSAGSAGASAAVAASIGDRVFAPSSITVAVGGTVTWTNDDDRAHTVTATGGSFDSGVLDQGGSFAQRFGAAGTFAFLCAIHPEMQGEVTVVGAGGGGASGGAPAATPTPAPTAAPTPASTPATIDGTADADAAPAAVTIEMRDFAFGPAQAIVADGGTVTFTNVGAAPHTATSAAGGFDTEMVASGSTTTVTVGGPGTYAFNCAFHPEMQGEIEVAAASTGAVPAATDAPASTSPSASAEPSPTAAAAATSPTASPTAAPPAIASTADVTPTATGGDALGGMVGLLVGVTLIAIAVTLFARTIGGVARRTE